LSVCCMMLLGSCSIMQPEQHSYESWSERHQDEVENLAAFLNDQGLVHVLPMPQLLRSASDWQRCAAEPFAVPPQQQWASVASVLRLLQQLQLSGVVGSVDVYSGYRNPQLNACADGAVASAHTRSFALDFKSLAAGDPTAALCDFWREKGKAWNMGFSRYTSGRIHIDTAGYRTWGYDQTGKSAVCPRVPEKIVRVLDVEAF